MSHSSDIKAENKLDDVQIENVEVGKDASVDMSWADMADDEKDEVAAGGFWGKFLKKSPSPQFLQDVKRMNGLPLDPKEIRRIERKVDMLIVPALAVCYAFYYVDKTTLSYAAIFKLREDLHLSGEEYSWLSSLFYFGWLAWAVPTNMLMHKFPLNKYLAFNIFLWGVLLMAQAASRNFVDLAILRTLSGAFEATADPAFVLITATWYTRAQQPRRIGYWYSANGLGIAVGGLLGYGIGHIPGKLSPWQYEFLIVGALCTAWSIALWFFVPDSPSHTHWFTRRERLMIISRKRDDFHGIADKREWKWQQVLESLIDPKTYLFFLFGFTANVPNGGTSNFGTLIVKGFGFDQFQTTLMQIPYGVIIVLFIMFAIFVNPLMPPNSRTWMMIITTIPTVIGFALIAFLDSNNKAGRLIGYWMTGASNATFVVGLSLVSGNVGGQTKKAMASAAVFLGVAAGNIVGPFLFLAREAPGYRTGIIACLASRSLEIVIIYALRVIFVASNAKRDKAEKEGRVPAYDKAELDQLDLTDWKNPAFRYVA